MSSLDTLTPFISAPWLDPFGRPHKVRPLPGLQPEILRELRHLTGSWYPKEGCPVFSPCLTLAIDEQGRRWISELSVGGRPGRVWCLFAEPTVAVYVSDTLAEFLSTLRERTCHGRLFSWLQDLTAQAHVIWKHRRKLARRPNRRPEAESEFAMWLATLPREAYVYDLRSTAAARGWPYGLVGPSGRLFRYRDQPVFAVAGPNLAGPRLGESDRTRSPTKGPRLEGQAIPLPSGRLELAGRSSATAQWERGARPCV
jgi:hypothetical protein